MDKNWDNLKSGKCIFCGNELSFRVRNRNTHIRSRKYQNNSNKDMYYCFKDNFQISRTNLNKLINKLK